MATKREPVSFIGILRGEGQEANCTVSATKVTNTDGTDFTYLDYKILSVTKQLPEGSYQLITNGEIIAVKCRNGGWLAG